MDLRRSPDYPALANGSESMLTHNAAQLSFTGGYAGPLLPLALTFIIPGQLAQLRAPQTSAQ